MSVPVPSRRTVRARARRRGFTAAFALALGVLVVLGAAGAAASLVQGPRVTGVQVDPAAAIDASGSRVILTANQALDEIDPAQVTVSPDAPFTVDAAGRSVGVRFTVPLDDATEYRVSVADVQGIGGGPSASLETTFTTPGHVMYYAQRNDSGDDAIFRRSLNGDRSTPVFTAEEIDDFRATETHLVVSVRDGDASAVYVMARDGSDPEELALPGTGTVAGLQVSAHGELVGFTYTDSDISADSGRESVLFTASLRDPSADPVPVEAAGDEPSVAEWRFVPDSSALLLLDFAGELMLVDPEEGGDPAPLGNAATIDAVSRGTYTAIVDRGGKGIVELDLTTGDESALAQPDEKLGALDAVLPDPKGGTVRLYTLTGDDGITVRSRSVVHVADDGTSSVLYEAESTDTLLQACVSPSGRYAAVLIAPDAVDNPFDTALQPLQTELETHILDLDGAEVAAFSGFDVSWCEVGPW